MGVSIRPGSTAAGRSRRSGASGSAATALDLALADLTDRWDRGESPAAEEYADWLSPDRPGDLVELAYREFRLADDGGLAPDPDAFFARFPDHAPALARVLAVHRAFDPARLGPGGVPAFPAVGDEMGPYRLIEELGRGGFARVFLAEQTDLDDRLVVVKVSTRRTPEPRLLARARHPHTVEVLWHGEVDGGALQLICMPFLGGATLSAVLAERRRRGGRTASGRDLLADLDRASTAGYPAPPAVGRPAREVIAALSYPGAVAWVVARLAEALDYAYGRGVLHGDVKPSNVLLTADGAPMLFDFNLSVDWRPIDAAAGLAPPGEAGGTLAYMAPERLRAVAEPETAPRPSAADRHRADVYALGVVLLELLSGRPPETLDDGAVAPRARSLRELASAYLTSRGVAGGTAAGPPRAAVAAGLRAILRRCLAVDPADRYRRASELAADLDRWRSDRPLAYARDPVLTTGLSRWARRRRPALVAALAGLTVACAATALAWRGAAAVRHARAAAIDSQIDAVGAGAFRSRRPGFGVVATEANPAGLARRHLERYGVLGDGDWRGRDEFAGLDPDRRDDTEVWLLEQALRFARALGRRSGQPDDWREGLRCLDRMSSERYAPLRAESAALRQRLGLAPPPPAAAGLPTPVWMDEYLSGVVAELREDDGGLADARRYYAGVLAARPHSFWGSYRAAAVAFAAADRLPDAPGPARAGVVGLYAEAAERLKACVSQRPGNALLRLQFASCLYYLGHFDDALRQCEAARDIDAENAETFATRAFLRLRLGQFVESARDVARYELLSGTRPPSDPTSPLQSPFGPVPEPAGSPFRTDPQTSFLIRSLGDASLKAGRHDLALLKYDRALELDPDDLAARFKRAAERDFLGRADADADLERLVGHPHFEDGLRHDPEWLPALYRLARIRLNQGRVSDAVEYATRARDLSHRYHVQEVESSYTLAVALATAAEADPGLLPAAVDHLKRAYREAPDVRKPWLQHWYHFSPAFAGLRATLGESALYETY